MKQRIIDLTAQLNQANYQYYVLDDPKMPDFEYDMLLRELENLEAEYPQFAQADSPSKRVGGEALSKFQKVVHPVPLMSLQDVFSLEELDDFLRKFFLPTLTLRADFFLFGLHTANSRPHAGGHPHLQVV